MTIPSKFKLDDSLISEHGNKLLVKFLSNLTLFFIILPNS